MGVNVLPSINEVFLLSSTLYYYECLNVRFGLNA